MNLWKRLTFPSSVRSWYRKARASLSNLAKKASQSIGSNASSRGSKSSRNMPGSLCAFVLLTVAGIIPRSMGGKILVSRERLGPVMEAAPQSRKVRVGIVGIGNCASSFVQGLSFYSDARANEPVPGLTNPDLGGYHVADIEISAAFDIDARKVGRDIAEAIYAKPNNTIRFAGVKPTGVLVERGPTMDGLACYIRH